MANSSGTLVQKNHYYPFGSVFASTTGAGKQPYKYNGKELDAMHGVNLYDYSARYMDSQIGRFTSVDPLAEKYYSISPYVYVGNNPLKYIDPTGMWIMLTDSTNNVNYRYDNGQLYRERMNLRTRTLEYVAYTPETGSFYEGVLDALNQLASTATGQSLIDFFSNDQNNIGIATNSIADGSNGNHIALGEQGYPTIFMKSNLQGSNIPTQAGIQQSPFWLDLGHELGHGHDRAVRGNDAATATRDGLVTSTGFILTRTEVYATFRENQMRREAGLPLRTHYLSNGVRGVGPALINSAGHSTFLRTPYLPTNTLPSPRRK
ncbi:RHS repeat-associated core domain-containing protein [Dysgonomonas sp. 521]|uniref:RHS repeat-associated core domain-containing protein n=1 Tax=Dysgonomonas sp. 521 TaxID=2302932 RepID=UPI00351B5AAB